MNLKRMFLYLGGGYLFVAMVMFIGGFLVSIAVALSG